MNADEEGLLTSRQRAKVDTAPDTEFYAQPRLVTHADDGFLARLTELYAAELAPGDRVLDAMSSWVSHLPAYEFARVAGHGLNGAELERNGRLDEWAVQDLNADQRLPFADGAFDAVLCALSVQYLQYPGRVAAEFGRVLAPDGVLVVSFTGRMFPTKAVRAWRETSMDGRVALVESYVDAAGFGDVRTVRERPESDPFAAVVARRE
jgi:Methylase involved in ubiquinone/menaquinone biosynthesis